MINLILTLSLFNAQPAATQTAQFQPCVWPNRCASVAALPVMPCVWPNRCVNEDVAARPITTCVWPNHCAL
ncbi:MAG: hypothetical protein HYZ74_07480 [Elusimicrobia bacterium]|nr:hypothetical protein [Elusimicrobiota bacterium]